MNVFKITLRRHRRAESTLVSRALRSFASTTKHSMVDAPSDGIKRTSTSTADVATTKSKQHYLHIAPDGDWWTGDEIFAAKHLQPDYVRSVQVPSEFDVEEWLELTFGDDNEKHTQAMQRIYDEQRLPHEINKKRE